MRSCSSSTIRIFLTIHVDQATKLRTCRSHVCKTYVTPGRELLTRSSRNRNIAMGYSQISHGMDRAIKINVTNANFYYGSTKALYDVNVKIGDRFITALIGPSGCGKSTFLRSLNRMNDLIPGTRLEGKVELEGDNVYSDQMDVIDLRRRVGMIFQRSNPFPMSIYDNVAYGVRV